MPRAKFIEVADVKIYRNKKLADWIMTNFDSDILRLAAIATVVFIRENWPETDEFLRGDLVPEGAGGKEE
jgi:hypothetical protein